MRDKKKKIIVAVSGGFDPLHSGHVRLFKKAKSLGDELVVILNNDNWLKKKKGFVFIPQSERKEILEAIKWVNKVITTGHTAYSRDMGVCRELGRMKPNIFANGGDRTRKNIPEIAVCKRINCRMVFNIGKGGKVQSSSWILQNFLNKTNHNAKK